ncbi:MAG: NAD(P)/FAD-dependent oxidoreductase [Microbacteriaceae bacterium]|nr:NAD(P)/FAD-dependent oxidoreductase [Microbacteriaceae bacterium]
MPKILIVGGGYAGFYTAWKLEKHLRRGEASVTLVDPLSYMTYQPFLPEVAAGSIQPRHVVVAFRRHLKKTRIVSARITAIDPEAKVATFTPQDGEPWQEEYDVLVVTAGSITRTFPIPGIADSAFGMKNIEEAVGIRDRLMGNFNRASNLHDSPLKRRLLNVTVVGGGFAGVEAIAELRSLSSYLVGKYPTIDFEETSFHLVEAMGRIMPEVSAKNAEWVVRDLEKRGVNVHLNAQLVGAEGGVIELATGEKFETDLLIWTAGVMAHPSAKGFGLPQDERGRIRANAALQVVTAEGAVVPGVWSAGDVAAVPDLSGSSPLPDKTCVPNAQHAVRQAKRLAKNLVAELRGEAPIDYNHKNAGAVAGLGLYNGVMQSGRFSLRGFPAWVAHRGYHGLAMPTWERKLRVVGDWAGNFFLKRELASLALGRPRAVFQEYALRPAARPRADEHATPTVADKAPTASVATAAAPAAPVAEKAPAKPRTRKPAAPKAE